MELELGIEEVEFGVLKLYFFVWRCVFLFCYWVGVVCGGGMLGLFVWFVGEGFCKCDFKGDEVRG